jgi:cation diffusion facilitator family transporter
MASHGHDHDEASHDHGHGHTHGVVDPTIATTSRGIWAIKWSFIGLAVTAILQLVVVVLSGSVALLADTIHNVGDAFTAVPLWIAFLLVRRPASKRFTYGFGRAEDLAGVVIVLVILTSAIIAGYQSVQRLINPRDIEYVWIVAGAGAIGFLGNEAVALFRIKVGKEINSAALIADGYHARVDGFTSLAVLGGAIAVGLGFPIADPIVGLVITALIAKIVWDSAKAVFSRILDGVDPEIIVEISHVAEHVKDVVKVTDVRARWRGHRLDAEVQLTVESSMSLEDAHSVTREVQHKLMHALPYLGKAIIHVDPTTAAGEHHHSIGVHQHDGLPRHAH